MPFSLSLLFLLAFLPGLLGFVALSGHPNGLTIRHSRNTGLTTPAFHVRAGSQQTGLISICATSPLGNAVTVTSLTNVSVKRLVKLRDQAKFRKQEGSALLTGVAPILELCSVGGAADGKLRSLVLLEEESATQWHDDFVAQLNTETLQTILVVSKSVFKKVVGVESADGKQAAAEVGLPAQASLEGLRRVLVLDRLQDPGNVGTLLRTAAGLGWEGVWLLDGTCDPLNDKTVKAAKGACWRLRMRQGSVSDFVAMVERKTQASSNTKDKEEQEEGGRLEGAEGCEVLVADMGGRPPVAECFRESRTRFLVLSNEGAGVSQEIQKQLDDDARRGKGVWQRVGVPLDGGVESLNVAVAGGILMYALQ